VHDLRSTQPLDRSISGHPSAIPVGKPFKKPSFSMIANNPRQIQFGLKFAF
jgi:hypothetical protein